MHEDHQQRCLSCRVRAYRWAHLVDADGDYGQARDVIALATLRWGGIAHVAVPVSGGEIEPAWWEFLRWYDPDLLWVHSQDAPDLSEPTDHGLLPFRIVARTGPDAPGWPRTLDPASYGASEPLHQSALWESLRRTGRTPLPNWRLVKTEQATDAAFLEAQVGLITSDGALDALRRAGVTEVTVDPGVPWTMTREQLEMSQLWQTSTGLRRRAGSSFSGFPSDVLVVSHGANLRDFALFWSVRAASMGWCCVHWVPLRWLHDGAGSLLSWLADKRSAVFGVDLMHLTSSTMSEGDIARAAASLSATGSLQVRVLPANDALEHHPDTPDLSAAPHLQDSPTRDGHAVIPVPLPGPDFIRPIGELGRWVIEVSVEDAGGGAQGIAFPRSAGLANRMVSARTSSRSKRRSDAEMRVTHDGSLAVGANGQHLALPFSLLSSRQLFQHALWSPGFAAASQPSLAGRHARAYRSAERSQNGIAAAHLAALLDDWSEVPALLSWIRMRASDGTRHVLGEYLADCTRSEKQIADKFGLASQAPHLIKHWVEHRMLLQGYYLKCPHCNRGVWYPLDDVGQSYRCSACLTPNQTPSQPEYSFSLAPLVADAIRGHQLLPLAVIGLLAREAEHDFLWEPETELRRAVFPGLADSDIDILCICDGRLIIGEVAESGGFGQNDARKLVELARILRPDEIVFGVMRRCMSDADSRIVDSVREQTGDIGTQVTILLEHQLLQGKREAVPHRPFRGSRKTKKVHSMFCRHMPSGGASFETYGEAAEQGYRPCKVCRPQDRRG